MEELLRFILSRITQYPDEILIEEEENSSLGQTDFNIQVHPEDVGIVIGKKGRIVKSLRNLINVIAAPQNLYVQINIKEKGGEAPTEETIIEKNEEQSTPETAS